MSVIVRDFEGFTSPDMVREVASVREPVGGSKMRTVFVNAKKYGDRVLLRLDAVVARNVRPAMGCPTAAASRFPKAIFPTDHS